MLILFYDIEAFWFSVARKIFGGVRFLFGRCIIRWRLLLVRLRQIVSRMNCIVFAKCLFEGIVFIPWIRPRRYTFNIDQIDGIVC